MKNQFGIPDFGIQGEIFVYIVLCSCHCIFLGFKNSFVDNLCISLKPTYVRA